MTPEAHKLRIAFDRLRAEGMIDLKFIFAPLPERTREEVCAAVNDMLDAIARRDYQELRGIGDSVRP